MKEFNTIVLGAGPAGYVCAIKLAQLGVDTAIVERENVGGVCLNEGCIPSKALINVSKKVDFIKNHSASMGITVDKVSYDHAEAVKFKNGVVKKLTGGIRNLLKSNGAELISGDAYIEAPGKIKVGDESYGFKNLVLATGSDFIELPFMPFSDPKVLSSRSALDLDHVPESITVIGGGYIGLELGMTFANLGSKVVVVEAMDEFLPGFEKDIQRPLKARMKKLGIDLKIGNMAQSYDDGVLVVEDKEGMSTELKTDYFLVSIGRKPRSKDLGLENLGVKIDEKGFVPVDERQKTNIPGVYAIGDLVADRPMLAHKGSYEGEVAAEVIAGKDVVYDSLSVPAVMFTDPEVASVGEVPDDAETISEVFPFAAIGKAVASGETDGFVKWTADKNSHKVLGCTIVGSHASDLISEACLAIEMGAVLEDLSLTMHPHPTMGESLMEAAKLTLGEPVHMAPKRKRA